MEKCALTGLRVVDFGQYISGPLLSMILADYGAEVIHIDPPGGPMWHNDSANAVFMRGKRRIVLDLKAPEDLELAKELIKKSDILVENFRPGVMDRLGLGKQDTAALNPALIYCSLPGFSEHDERRTLPAWEGILAAETGLYADVMSGKIRFNALYMNSVFAAIIACHSVVAALIVREKCGRAQNVEVPLYDAGFEVEGIRGIDPPPVMDRKNTNGKKIPDYQLFKLLTKYPCRDGKYLQVTPPPRGQKLMTQAFIPASWGYESELTPAQDTQLREVLASRTSIEWEKLGQEKYLAGVVQANTADQWMRDDSAISSRTVIPVDDYAFGTTMQPGVPSIMQKCGDCAGQIPRSEVDADRAWLLENISGWKAPAYTATAAPESPLAGMKVLDFCQVLAGPISGRLMAEYGAEVLKINNPRVFENPIAMVGHETVNNGKQTVFLDLKSNEGRKIIRRLIEECDIFHCNFSQSAYESLGITEAELRAKNPELILSQINVHSLGGWRALERGHEDLGEAVAGISCRYGGGPKPENVPVLICDNMTGHCACIGVMLAVYHRIKTGRGQRVQASLSRSATLVQLPYMISYPGKIWDEPAGPKAVGWSMWNRLYQTSDGYVFAALPEKEAVQTLPCFAGVAWASPQAEQAMETVFLTRPSAYWQTELSVGNNIARRVRAFAEEVMEEAYAKRSGLSCRELHEGIGVLRTVCCSGRLSLTPAKHAYPCRAAGADTERFIAAFYETHPDLQEQNA